MVSREINRVNIKQLRMKIKILMKVNKNTNPRRNKLILKVNKLRIIRNLLNLIKKMHWARIIKKVMGTRIINKALATRIIKKILWARIIKKVLGTRIIKKQLWVKVIKKVLSTRIIIKSKLWDYKIKISRGLVIRRRKSRSMIVILPR